MGKLTAKTEPQRLWLDIAVVNPVNWFLTREKSELYIKNEREVEMPLP